VAAFTEVLLIKWGLRLAKKEEEEERSSSTDY